jgi:hypothetical protein
VSHIISLGAGVQSSTMALMASRGEILPMPVCAIFADTQAEPKSVYRWLDWLEKQLPFPVHRITKGNLTEALLNPRQRRDGKGVWLDVNIPAYTRHKQDESLGITPRECTYKYKVEILDRECRRVGKIKKGQKTVGVIMWMGISLDEVHRMKTPRHPWHALRYPLVDLRMRRGDCLAWMRRNQYPEPPRSACVYCPYRSNAQWRKMRDEEPAEFAEAVRVDKEFRRIKRQVFGSNSVPFLHNSRVPLDEVDFSTDVDRGQMELEGFGNDCTGMCGV